MKKITAMLCTVLMAVSLTACGGGEKKKEVTVDVEKLAEELLTTVTTDTLAKMSVDPSTVYFYEADDVAKVAAYASSGTTACEVAVIESKDASKTGEIAKLLQDRVENQETLYSSYNAEEAAKLKDAIIKEAGSYSVLCVCDDTDQAEKILKEYGF